MIHLPEIKTADLSTYRNFAKCHQALFCVPRVGLGARLLKHSIPQYIGMQQVLGVQPCMPKTAPGAITMATT